MDIQTKLTELGLNKSEINVYLYLLSTGVSTPPQIAKGTGIARTNCYQLLNSLKDQKLVQVQAQRKRKAYVARDPAALLAGLEYKLEVAQQLVPQLRDFYVAQENKPEVKFYEGWKEVEEIFKQTLEAEKIYGLASGLHLYAENKQFFKWYQDELNRKKILFDDIFTSKSREEAKDAKAARGALHSFHFLPSRCDDLPTDILLWNDNIALITLKDPVFGTVITSEPLTRTMRILFDIAWENTKME